MWWCWLARRQHGRQHVQFTRGKEELVKSRRTALGAFRKKARQMQCERTFWREKGGNIISVVHAILRHATEEQRTKPSPEMPAKNKQDSRPLRRVTDRDLHPLPNDRMAMTEFGKPMLANFNDFWALKKKVISAPRV